MSQLFEVLNLAGIAYSGDLFLRFPTKWPIKRENEEKHIVKISASSKPSCDRVGSLVLTEYDPEMAKK